MKRPGNLVISTLSIWLLLITSLACAQDTTLKTEAGEQKVWVINDYRYETNSDQDDPAIGHSICSNTCNAMSFDFRNVLMPGGWRYIRFKQDQELVIAHNNPFIGGHCICTADEYLIKIDDYNRPSAIKDPQPVK